MQSTQILGTIGDNQYFSVLGEISCIACSCIYNQHFLLSLFDQWNTHVILPEFGQNKVQYLRPWSDYWQKSDFLHIQSLSRWVFESMDSKKNTWNTFLGGLKCDPVRFLQTHLSLDALAAQIGNEKYSYIFPVLHRDSTWHLFGEWDDEPLFFLHPFGKPRHTRGYGLIILTHAEPTQILLDLLLLIVQTWKDFRTRWNYH